MVNGTDPAAAIRRAIRSRLRQIAADLGDCARLEPVSADTTDGAAWRLQPVHPDAAPITWHESRTDDWAAYLTLGVGTEVHVLP